jgi:hypothetical protein
LDRGGGEGSGESLGLKKNGAWAFPLSRGLNPGIFRSGKLANGMYVVKVNLLEAKKSGDFNCSRKRNETF